MRWYFLLAASIALLLYIVIGGIAYSFIERNYEAQVGKEILKEVQEFMDANGCLTQADMIALNQLYSDMHDAGLQIDANGNLVNVTRWDIRTAIFFALQLVATIGFPALAPLSDGGRAFTIIFAIFGIPLFLVAAIGMGEVMNLLAETLRLCIISKSHKSCSPKCGAMTFRILIISILGIFFFIIIPSIIFANIEPWTYADAFYFSFITLATIGFGDLVPTYNDVPWMSENYRNWYRLAVAFWILLLSAWLVGVLVAIQITFAEATAIAEQKFHQKVHGITTRDFTTHVKLDLKKDLMIKNQRGSYPDVPVEPFPMQEQQQVYHRTPSVHSNANDFIPEGSVTRIAV